jgi:F-type H+-transporting ATPase subunit gamma
MIKDTAAKSCLEYQELNFDNPDKYKLPELLLSNTGANKVLLLILTSERGLCGSFNSSVIKKTEKEIKKLKAEGKEIVFICAGKKGSDYFKKRYPNNIIKSLKSAPNTLEESYALGNFIKNLYENKEISEATLIFNKFKTAISQEVQREPMLPFDFSDYKKKDLKIEAFEDKVERLKGKEIFGLASTDFEPKLDVILNILLPQYLNTLIFNSALNSLASEHGSRMSSMDNATRNAGDIIKSLTLKYNRTRQDCITRELIEIISGAEAL